MFINQRKRDREDSYSNSGNKRMFTKILSISGAVVGHTFNPSTREAKAGDLCEFKASLIYKS